MEHVIGLILLGLGIASPGQVQGVTTIAQGTNVFQQFRGGTTGLPGASFFASPGGTRKDLEERREQAKEAFKAQREAFEQKLQIISDEKKRALVARLNKNLNDVNRKRTDQMIKHLDKMTEILEKVKARAARAKANGRDIAGVDAAVTKAQADIATARTAILAQAGKQYHASITSETSLKTDMGTAMKTLQSDLQTVRDLVIAAQKSVGDAIRALAGVLGEAIPGSVVPTASPSGGKL